MTASLWIDNAHFGLLGIYEMNSVVRQIHLSTHVYLLRKMSIVIFTFTLSVISRRELILE